MDLPVGSSYCRISACVGSGFAYFPAYVLQRVIPLTRGSYATASRLMLTFLGGTGMLTRFPSSTPFGLDLGPD